MKEAAALKLQGGLEDCLEFLSFSDLTIINWFPLYSVVQIHFKQSVELK